jgi:hypothetical protein
MTHQRSSLAVFVLLGSALPPCAGTSNAERQDNDFSLPSRFEAGLGLRFMPIGWFDIPDAANRSFRAYPAIGFAPFVDYRLSGYFSVGFAPEVSVNVIPNRSDYYVGEMLLFDARLQVRYPNQSHFEPYVIATGGYSVIWRNGASTAYGPAVGVTLGLRGKFAVRHALFAEASYQKGFQSTGGDAYRPSYVIMSVGWQAGF